MVVTSYSYWIKISHQFACQDPKSRLISFSDDSRSLGNVIGYSVTSSEIRDRWFYLLIVIVVVPVVVVAITITITFVY